VGPCPSSARLAQPFIDSVAATAPPTLEFSSLSLPPIALPSVPRPRPQHWATPLLASQFSSLSLPSRCRRSPIPDPSTEPRPRSPLTRAHLDPMRGWRRSARGQAAPTPSCGESDPLFLLHCRIGSDLSGCRGYWLRSQRHAPTMEKKHGLEAAGGSRTGS
jgi:hypothetical protein